MLQPTQFDLVGGGTLGTSMQTFFRSLGSWKVLAAIALAGQICSAAGQPVNAAKRRKPN
jgi:hypothetical protein